jgi:hypothetical protein
MPADEKPAAQDPEIPEAFLADSDDDEPTNPFDPEALRADDDDDDIPTVRVVHNLSVRKPNKMEFFRVHPTFTSLVYMIEVGEGVETEKYVVVPALAKEIIQETSKRRLFVCVDRRGKPFLWPAKVPQAGGGPNTWTTTALEVAESAKRYWVRLIADMGQRHYEECRAAQLDDEPKWPDMSYAEILGLAFKNKLISDYDHEVLKGLRGEQ